MVATLVPCNKPPPPPLLTSVWSLWPEAVPNCLRALYYFAATILRQPGIKMKLPRENNADVQRPTVWCSGMGQGTGLITQLKLDRRWEGSAALCKKNLARRSQEPFLAMVRLECLLYAVGLTALGAGKTDAFYLPGGAPNSFRKDEKVSRPSSNAAAPHPLHCLLQRQGCLGSDAVGSTISLVMCTSKQG